MCAGIVLVLRLPLIAGDHVHYEEVNEEGAHMRGIPRSIRFRAIPLLFFVGALPQSSVE